MGNSISKLIIILKKDPHYNSHSEVLTMLNRIEKFGDDEFTKAFLLGCLAKHILNKGYIGTNEFSLLKEMVGQSFIYFFLQREKPVKNVFGKIVYLFIAIGLFSIIIGSIQLITHYFWEGTGSILPVIKVKEGGGTMIFGIILFVGGLIRLRYEKRRSKFINEMINLSSS